MLFKRFKIIKIFVAPKVAPGTVLLEILKTIRKGLGAYPRACPTLSMVADLNDYEKMRMELAIAKSFCFTS